MIKKLTQVRPALFAALWCGVTAASALAQDPAASPAPGSPGPLTTPPALLPAPPVAVHHHGPPPMPLFDALDTNHDGVISAEEIANASASLKALLKNGSDHLTREDLRPVGAPPPPPPGGPAPDEAAPAPRPQAGDARPHRPKAHPPEGEEMAGPEMSRWRRPAPDQEEAAGDDGRPHPWRRFLREHDRMMRMQEEESMDEARPQPRHERMGRHEGPTRPEDADDAERAVRPPRPEGRREDHAERPHRGPGPEETGSRPARHGPPPSPLFDALDTNHDGTISAEEIANASASLKGLLKNGHDHLTRDDLRPADGPPPAER